MENNDFYGGSILEVINELVGDTKIHQTSDSKTRIRSINNVKIMSSMCLNFVDRLSREIDEYSKNGDKEALNICINELESLKNKINSIQI